MGVVYKLTPEVSAFIIEQKRADPKATCQNLSGRVFLQFGEHVSKSSIHALLKQAKVITPRQKKIKDTFKIPAEKKAQISKALAPFKAFQSPAPAGADTQAPKVAEPAASPIEKSGGPAVDLNIKPFVPLAEEPVVKMDDKVFVPDAGTVFLKAALWDLSFKPVLGIKDFSDIDHIASNPGEWNYLTQDVYAIKLETDQGVFYLDPRLQTLNMANPGRQDWAAPIERAIGETTDTVLNNIQPLIIRDCSSTVSMAAIYAFLDAFEHGGLQRIALLNRVNREFTEFKTIIKHKRKIAIGISSKPIELQGLMSDNQPERLLADQGLKVISYKEIYIITNLITNTYEEIVSAYKERHPGHLDLQPVSSQGMTENSWLRGKLKQRALMFFPSLSSLEDLEAVLSLTGYHRAYDNILEVSIQIPADFFKTAQLDHAITQINAMNIRENNGRKLRILRAG